VSSIGRLVIDEQLVVDFLHDKLIGAGERQARARRGVFAVLPALKPAQ
jgi:hypothetical protein